MHLKTQLTKRRGEKAHPKVGLVPETTRSINNKSPDRR